MSDLPGGMTPPEDDLDLGEIADDLEPTEPEVDADGNPIEPEPEVDADGNPIEPGREPPQTQQQRRRGEAARWRERAERNERELAELRGQVQGLTQARSPAGVDPAAQARAEAEKWERRATMSPVELAHDMAREFQQTQQQSLLAVQLQTQELLDKQAYDTEARTSKRHREYRDRVEQTLRDERARGNLGATRAAILRYLVGDDAIARAGQAEPAQRRAAQRRVNGQRVPPVSPRGDGATAGGRNSNDLEAARRRLAGQPLWE